MSGTRWDCFSYSTGLAAARDETGALIRVPGPGEAREWRRGIYQPFLAATYADVADALAWLEDTVREVAAWIATQPHHTVPNTVDVTRAAADAIARAFAYQWQAALPGGHTVVLALYGHYEMRPRPADPA